MALKRLTMIVLAALALGAMAEKPAGTLPEGFVRLADVAPGIVQDMRYATAHNFTGAQVPGYEAGVCILTEAAARALAEAQAAVQAQGFTLIVWDCYRPARAVAAFVAWAKGPDESAKAEFYPRVPKGELFERGYIASRSRHSSGSTVDVGLAPLGLTAAPQWTGGAQVDCTAPTGERFTDGAADFGTGYDCFDARAHVDAADISTKAKVNRVLLGAAMVRAGFEPYAEEWWHFTLKDEPHKGQAFDFPVR